jgi:hypothetical protein
MNVEQNRRSYCWAAAGATRPIPTLVRRIRGGAPSSTTKVARNAVGHDRGRDELIGPSPQAYLGRKCTLQVAERETILTAKSSDARARAEASFRKEERAKEGAKAMVEYHANSRMVREKTERLKALRLAKEAADKERAG